MSTTTKRLLLNACVYVFVRPFWVKAVISASRIRSYFRPSAGEILRQDFLLHLRDTFTVDVMQWTGEIRVIRDHIDDYPSMSELCIQLCRIAALDLGWDVSTQHREDELRFDVDGDVIIVKIEDKDTYLSLDFDYFSVKRFRVLSDAPPLKVLKMACPVRWQE